MNDLLGTDLDAQLGQYAATMAYRNTVTQLANQLASSNSPLTPQQADQLTQIIAQQGLDASSINSSPNGRNPAIIAALSGTLAGIPLNQADFMVIADSMEQSSAGALVTDAAISKAQEILTPQQLAALRVYQMQASDSDQTCTRAHSGMSRMPFGWNLLRNLSLSVHPHIRVSHEKGRSPGPS